MSLNETKVQNGNKDKRILILKQQTSAWGTVTSTVHRVILVNTACRNAVVLVLELPAEVADHLSGQVTREGTVVCRLAHGAEMHKEAPRHVAVLVLPVIFSEWADSRSPGSRRQGMATDRCDMSSKTCTCAQSRLSSTAAREHAWQPCLDSVVQPLTRVCHLVGLLGSCAGKPS